MIRALGAAKLDIAMKKPFGISGGAQVEAKNVLVTLDVEGGRGLGEGAPFPAFNGETQEAVLAACAAAAPLLVGVDLDDTDAIVERVAAACAGSASAKCAIETAVVDARARLAGLSLDVFLGGLGGLGPRRLVTDVTITTGTVAEARAEALAFRAFSTLKIKVGNDVDRDVARVLAVRDARPDARILVDANGGFDVAGALAFAAGVQRGTIALFEQPVAPGSWDALAEVRRTTGLTVAIDESVTCVEDVVAAKKHRAADAVNLKIMKSGIFTALAIAKRTKEEGLLPMIGGMVETRLAMGTSACIAAALGGFAFIDLDTPLFLATDPFDGGYLQTGEHIDLSPVTLGHGLRPAGRAQFG